MFLEILLSEAQPVAVGLCVHASSGPDFTEWSEGANRVAGNGNSSKEENLPVLSIFIFSSNINLLPFPNLLPWSAKRKNYEQNT